MVKQHIVVGKYMFIIRSKKRYKKIIYSLKKFPRYLHFLAQIVHVSIVCSIIYFKRAARFVFCVALMQRTFPCKLNKGSEGFQSTGRITI